MSENAYVKCGLLKLRRVNIEKVSAPARLPNSLGGLNAFIFRRSLPLQISSIFHWNINIDGRQCPNCQILQEIEANPCSTRRPRVYNTFPAIAIELPPSIIPKWPSGIIIYCIAITSSQLPIQWARILESSTVDSISTERCAKAGIQARENGGNSLIWFSWWILFYNPSRLSGEPDPWGSCHANAVSRVLQGRNKIKCLISFPSYMDINTVHLLQLHPFILSTMLHSYLLSLQKTYFMLVLPCSHGQQVLSLHTFTRRLTSLLVQTAWIAAIIFKRWLMAAARTMWKWWLGRLLENLASLHYVRNSRLAHPFPGISQSLWQPRRMANMSWKNVACILL